MSRISDAAVKAKTGKTWEEWFAVLDGAGARSMGHKEIVAYLNDNYEFGGWWQQMVTVTYEQALGLREVHHNPKGFQISRSKTLLVSVETLYRAWSDPVLRGRWLKDEAATVRSATPSKSLRMTWSDEISSVEVLFYAKGDAKSQVVVQHSKLPDAAAASKMKAYWAEKLELLTGVVES